MSAIGPFAIPILAVGTFAATLGWFGYQHMARQPAPSATVAADPAGIAPKPKAVSGPEPAPATPGEKPAQIAAARPDQPAASSPPPSAAAPAPEAPAPGAPAFDVVRVEPAGDTVVAGRASPGASVELLLNGNRHSRVIADPSGLFAIVPEPLPPGSHELALQVSNGEGTRTRSVQSVTVVVAANRRDAPLVTITAPGQPAVVLSSPDAPAAVASATPRAPAANGGRAAPAPAGEGTKPVADAAPSKSRRPVEIVSVETEGAGRLLVSGSAAPAAVVRLYLNDTFIAPASAGGDGRIAFTIERGMQPGSYKVRLDDVDPVSGQVRSRAEVPFAMPFQVAGAGRAEEKAAGRSDAARSGDSTATRLAAADGGAAPRIDAAPADLPTPAVVVPEINTATVSRGDSLWAISKRTYGAGLRYTVIYGANAKQIRDPDLIYPGQLFVLPMPAGEAASR